MSVENVGTWKHTLVEISMINGFPFEHNPLGKITLKFSLRWNYPVIILQISPIFNRYRVFYESTSFCNRGFLVHFLVDCKRIPNDDGNIKAE